MKPKRFSKKHLAKLRGHLTALNAAIAWIRKYMQQPLIDAIAAMQSLCPHKRTKYRHDPSGNNDNEETCEDCGNDLR